VSWCTIFVLGGFADATPIPLRAILAKALAFAEQLASRRAAAPHQGFGRRRDLFESEHTQIRDFDRLCGAA